MTKQVNHIICPLTRGQLQGLIKIHGLQTCIFDTSLLLLDWDGLEYQFHVNEGQIYLFRIIVRMDVVVGEVWDYEEYIF